jgi:hypothetical protein
MPEDDTKRQTPPDRDKKPSDDRTVEGRVAAHKRGVVDRAARRFEQSVRRIWPDYDPK